jgi:hypothetical protein
MRRSQNEKRKDVMSNPLLEIWNGHDESCGAPPAITNKGNEKYYYGYFENRFGEQWVFVYDFTRKVGELRGGDIGWDKVIEIRDAKPDVILGKAEAAWLLACWTAATGVG